MSVSVPNGYQTALGIVERDTHAGIRRRIPGHAERLAADSEEKPSRFSFSSISRILLIATAVMLTIAMVLYGSAVYFGEGLSRAGHSASTQKLEIVVANHVLNVPENTIRFSNQRRNGVQNRLDLYLNWPSLSGYKDELKHVFSSANGSSELLFITIEPRTMSFDMSGRLKTIYSLFFEGMGIQASHGLIRQPLSETGGFIDEDMYYQPDSPYPFTTRCVREASKIGAPFCIRDIHLGKDLMVTYRFHKKFLNQWMELDQAVRGYTNALILNQS